MCRSIKTLHHLTPAASDDEVRASALQYVRKLSGYRKPSRANEAAFEQATEDIAAATRRLLDALVGQGEPRTREALAAKRKERFERRG